VSGLSRVYIKSLAKGRLPDYNSQAVSVGVQQLPVVALILWAGLALPAMAQTPNAASQQSFDHWVTAIEQSAQRDAASGDKAARAAAQARLHEFNTLLADFADSWNKLISLSRRGGWSAKDARKTRLAFERLVHCEAWIEESEGLAPKQSAKQATAPEAGSTAR